MAKGRQADSGGRSNKVRVVMMDADLSDEAVTDLSNLLLHAFRPVHLRTIDRKTLASGNGAADGAQEHEVAIAEPDEETEGSSDTTQQVATAPKRSGPRKPPSPPDYLPDLLTKEEGDSFREFVADAAPTTDARRYLVATTWLRDVQNLATVNVDQMYTCYKTAKWPLGLTDWDVNFRNHVAAHRMQRIKKGEYKLTPLGEAELQTKDKPV